METAVSTDIIIYCSALTNSVATILDAAFNRLCFLSASMDLPVGAFGAGAVAEHKNPAQA
jgi:hypothetical protein